jgi:hypothetical protein
MVTTEPRLDHQTVKVKQLIDDYRSGRIVIPEFQPDYVWKKNKAPKLIDSFRRFHRPKIGSTHSNVVPDDGRGAILGSHHLSMGVRIRLDHSF